jgi:hypothetical protein
MRRAMNQGFRNRGFRFDRVAAFGLVAGLLGLSAASASAESAFIQQASGSVPAGVVGTPGASQSSFVPTGSHTGSAFVPTPELTVPARTQASNIARSVTVGSFNNVVQLQGGQNDLSSATVLGGSHNNVGVFQGGNNDLSNVVLLGMRGSNVAVLQPPGAAPVNMLIARLPNGALLIKR